MNPSLPTLPTHCQRCRWQYRHCHTATLPPPFRVAAAAVPHRRLLNFNEMCHRPLAASHPFTLKGGYACASAVDTTPLQRYSAESMRRMLNDAEIEVTVRVYTKETCRSQNRFTGVSQNHAANVNRRFPYRARYRLSTNRPGTTDRTAKSSAIGASQTYWVANAGSNSQDQLAPATANEIGE